MQIRTKLTLQFIVVVTLIIVFGFGVIYYTSSTYRRAELYQRLENKAKTSAEIFASVRQIDSTMQRVLDRTQKDKLPFENISIYNSGNRLIYTNNDSLVFAVTPKLCDEIRRKGRKEFSQGGFEILGTLYGNHKNSFVIFAGAIDQFGMSKLRNLRNAMGVLFFVIISIVALAGWIYAGRALKPLSKVIHEVEAMEVNHLDKRLDESGNKDEIGHLITTFNTLLDRLENAFKLQKLFVSAASHELKNPLTSITSQLQVSLINERTTSEYKGSMTSILEDIKSLNRTTHDLMEYARLNYENQIQLSGIRIDDLFWYCRDYFNKTRPDYIVKVNLANMPEDQNKLVVEGNEALLKIAFTNLIDNACKFSNDNTCEVSMVFGVNGSLLVKFVDHGIGLDEDERALVFEPFYRANSTSETKGNGIGLALTKKIMQLHNVPIDIVSEKGRGTTFILSFRQHVSFGS